MKFTTRPRPRRTPRHNHEQKCERRNRLVPAVERLEDRLVPSVEPITLVDSSLFGDSGDRGSLRPSISSDGQLVVFSSDASNLVANDTNNFRDVFLFNRGTGEVSLLSVNSAGTGSGNNTSENVRISRDGRFVVFESFASNLHAGVTFGGGVRNVFVRDLQTGTTHCVSVNPAGTAEGNLHSTNASFSGDGLTIAFESGASNLVTGDSNGFNDIFVASTLGGPVIRASVKSDGSQGNGASQGSQLSGDGRFLLFTSDASNLDVNDGNSARDVFQRDLLLGTTTLLTRDSGGVLSADGASIIAPERALSDDGRYVVFQSSANNHVPGTSGSNNIFLRDTATNTTSVVSMNLAGTAGVGGSQNATISGNGRFVAFVANTAAGQQVNGAADSNGGLDVFVRDLFLGATYLASWNAANSGTGNAQSGTGVYPFEFSGGYPRVSDDGRWVVFESEASNLVSGVSDGNQSQASAMNRRDIFVRDLLLNTSRQISVTPVGTTGSNHGSFTPVVSDNFVYVAYESLASNLIVGDNNVLYKDIYVRDLAGLTTSLASHRSPFLPAERLAEAGGALRSISTDGRYVAFTSNSPANSGGFSDLTPGTNASFGVSNIFVRDRQTGAITLENVLPSGSALNGGNTPVLSGDGLKIIFNSSDSLDPLKPSTGAQTFVRNRQTLTTSLVTIKPSGTPSAGTNTTADLAFSADGNLVAFTSSAADLITGFTNNNGSSVDLYIRNLTTGETRLVSRQHNNNSGGGNGSSYHPIFSANGEKLIFMSRATDLKNISDTNNAPDIFIYDVATQDLELVSVNSSNTGTGNAVSGNGVSNDAFFDTWPSISANGRFVLFHSRASNLVGAGIDTNGTPDIYLRDVDANQTFLLSRAGSVSANDESMHPSMSADARYVAFQSIATNLLPGFVNNNGGSNDVYLLDLQDPANPNPIVTLVSAQAGSSTAGGNRFSYAPVVSADGRYVSYASDASTIVAGFMDANGIGEMDLFLYDRLDGSNVLVSASNSGTTGSNDFQTYTYTAGPGFFDSGNRLFFQASASNLVNGDRNYDADAFVYTPVGAGRISGRLFHQVIGQPGIPYWTVYIDADGDGAFDAGERNVQTDSSGNYAFTNLDTNSQTYQVRLIVQPRWEQTVPPAFHEVTLTAGSPTSIGNDFGVVPLEPDLRAQSISMPASGNPGQVINVSWGVANQASANAVGDWQDAVYLSLDATLDASDQLVAIKSHTGGLAGLNSYSESTPITVPPVTEGTYYVLVQTDRRRQVDDLDRGNNTAASLTTLTVTLTPLTLGLAYNDGFTGPNQDRYYQVTVPAGETLKVALASNASSGGLEVYVHRTDLPTPYSFEAAGRAPAQPDQQAVIALTQPGTYYILARSRSGAAANDSFTITASLPGFGIDSIDRTSGGNTGRVTVGIRGLRFTPDTTVSLAPTFAGPTLNAVSVDFRDSTLLYATFDLQGQAVGAYDLQVADGGDFDTTSFAVVVGTANPLEVRLNVPTNVRHHGQIYTGVVEYINVGNTDITAPLMELTATHAKLKLPGQVSFSGSFTSSSSIQFLGIASDGPAGVLRPGQTGQALFYFQPGPDGPDFTVSFLVNTLASTTDTIDWASLKNDLRPQHISSQPWDDIYVNLTAAAGSTTGQYQQLLAANATYLSQLGIYTSDVSRLFGFEVQQADAFQLGRTLAARVDAAFPTPGLPLGLAAVYMQPISGRYRPGALGRGWAHNWDIQLTNNFFYHDGVVQKSEISIFGAGSQRFFTLQDNGTYQGAPGDHATLTRLPANAGGTNGAFLLRETDGTLLAFRADGKIDYIQDTNGNRITAGYDGIGRLVTLKHSADPVNFVLTIAYNAQGRIDTVTDPAGRVTSYAYDPLDPLHLVSVTDNLGTRQYEYGAGHTLTKITNIDGTEVNYQYDAAGRLIHADRGGPTVEPVNISYDAFAGVIFTDAFSQTTTVFYNDAGQAELLRDPLGRQAQFNYDSVGNLVQTLSPTGLSYSFTYDSVGNLLRQVNPLGHTIHMTYDSTFNNLTSITDPKNNRTQYAYDIQSNLRSITYANGSQEQFSYDPLGNLAETINRRGNAIDYQVNARGLVTRKDFADGSYHEFDYDARGNMTAARMYDGTATLTYEITMTYDPVTDELTRIDYLTDSRWLEFTYVAGRRTRSVDQDGFTVEYGYDAAGRLSELTDGALPTPTLIVQYTYDNAGRLVQKDLGNGTFTTYVYDDAGQLLSLVNHKDLVTINSQFDYTYDNEGRRTSMTLTDNDAGTANGITTYEYDALGQLTTVTLPGGRTIEYQYDAAGNRIQVIDSLLGSTAYVANNLNQYVSVGGMVQTYDLDGNLTSDGVSTYTWDDQNQLLQVVNGPNFWSYEYDPFGNRRSMTQNGTRTEYLIDPTRLVNVTAEYGPGGALIANYTAGFGLVSRVAGGAPAYYDFDALGSTMGITDGTGSYVNRYSYLPFGETTTIGAPALPNVFKFVGQFGVQQNGDGLALMHYRNHSAITGQFLSDDPLGLGGGDANLRRYVANDPAGAIDPWGLQESATGQPSPLEQFLDWAIGKEERVKLITEIENNAFGFGLASNALKNRADIAQKEGKITRDQEKKYWDDFLGGLQPDKLQKKLDELNQWWREYLKWNDKFKNWLSSLKLPGWPTKPAGSNGSGSSSGQDPNDIVGPAGFGLQNYIEPSQTLPYTIHFENAAPAVVPAQEVVITHQLDSSLDWTTFALGTFGFGDLIVEMPDGLQDYATSLDVQNMDGSPLRVDVNAHFDLSTGIVIWIFRSIDPATGELPLDAFAGFLPVNDDSHRGEGFVTYTVKAKSGLTTGTEIRAIASIVFDGNSPITTNQVDPHDPSQGTDPNKEALVTIDSGNPASSVNALPAIVTSPAFTVSWGGSDGGAGIAFFDIFVSIDGGTFALWQDDIAASSAIYNGTLGHTYAFYSVAFDNVGNAEPTPLSAQATTRAGSSAMTLRKNGASWELRDDATNTLIVDQVALGANPLVIGDSNGQADILTVDFVSGGAFDLLAGSQFNGGGGLDLLQATGDVNFTLADAGLTSGVFAIGLSGIDQARLTGGASANILNVLGFSGDTTLTGGLGADTIIGGSGLDTLLEAGNVHFTLTHTSLTGGMGPDVLSGIERANLTGGTGKNKLNASLFTGAVTLSGGGGGDVIKGGSGNDVLTGGLGSDTIKGGGGTDVLLEAAAGLVASVKFTLTNTKLTGLGINVLSSIERAQLIGTPGNDKMNASMFTRGPVTLEGGLGNDTINGTKWNDIVLGNGGNDILNGRVGRDLLIGGDGADNLNGGAGDDMLIAGSTTHDGDLSALTAFMSEWARTDQPYGDRIDHLTGAFAGGNNAPFFLDNNSLFDDTAAVDVLAGSTELDWFFSKGDTVTDLNTGGTEMVTAIP